MMSGDQYYYYYDALAATVRFKDITSSAHNRALFHRINNNDPSLKSLSVMVNDNYFHGPNFLLLREGDDLGFLGYYIGKNTALTKLVIKYLPEDSEQVITFFKGVGRNETIRSIEAEGYPLGRDSALNFALGLLQCTSLVEYYGILTGEIIDALASRPMIKSVASNDDQAHVDHSVDNHCLALELLGNKLSTLYLDDVGIGNAGLKCLAAGLARNHSLVECSLSRNNIGDEGLKFLAVGLAEKCSLHTLRLNDNNISCDGITCLASSLAHHGLDELNVSWNNIGDKGLEALATALLGNGKLRALDISRNNIGNTGLVFLATSLLQNETLSEVGLSPISRALQSRKLQELDLSGNPAINATGLNHLKRYLWSENCSLCCLVLESINVDSDGASILADALAHNKSLESLTLDRTSYITSAGWAAFSRVLCDSTSAGSVYLSNHTLQHFPRRRSRFELPLDDVFWLGVNSSSSNKSMVAKYKILKCFRDLDMTPLLELNLKLLPFVIDWFQTISFPSNMRSIHDEWGQKWWIDIDDEWAQQCGQQWSQIEASIRSRELSAIYKFVSEMPGLVVKDYYRYYLKQQLQVIQESKSRLLEDMQMLEEREVRLTELLASSEATISSNADVATCFSRSGSKFLAIVIFTFVAIFSKQYLW